MGDKNNTGQGRSISLRRARNTQPHGNPCRTLSRQASPNRTNGAGRVVVCCGFLVGAMLSWNVYAQTEESPAVYYEEAASASSQLDSMSPGIQDSDNTGASEISMQILAPIQTEPSSGDVARLDTTKGGQNSRRALVVSQETSSLDIVYTAVESDNNTGQEANINMVYQGDQSVAAYKVMLPVTKIPKEYERRDAVVKQSGENSGQPENDNARIPYSVVLAIFALIGLASVARRNSSV